MDKILTVPEIAEYLKVSRTTVWRWCNEGRLPAFRIGRHWRIYRSDIERLIGRKLGELDNAKRETEFV